MSKDNNVLDNIILTRFKKPSSMEGLLTDGVELIPSLAAHKYSPDSNNHALEFGDYGLLGNPEWLNPKKNIIYARDASTPLSPVSIRLPDENQYERLKEQFGDIPLNDLSKIENMNGFFMNHNMSPQGQQISQQEAIKRFTRNNPNYPMDEFGKAQALGSYLGDLYNFLRENGSKVSFPLPTDENSLRNHILNHKREFWEERTAEARKPLINDDDIERVAAKLTDKNIHWMPQRRKIKDALSRNLDKQFSAAESEIEQRLENNEYDKDKDSFAKYTFYEPQMKNGDLEDFLEQVNGIITGHKNKASKYARAAGNSIKRMETPFMEVKVPRMVKAREFLGAVYPEGRNSLNDKINDVYGDKAVPYRRGIDLKETNHNKMEALGELARRAGVIK